MPNPFDDILKRKYQASFDTKLAFSVWSEKQPFHKKLPPPGGTLTISRDQLLLLMQAAYDAGYARAKL